MLSVFNAMSARSIGILGQLYSIYLVGVLGQEKLGEYFVFISWANILAVLSTLGLHTYILRYCSSKFGQKEGYSFFGFCSFFVLMFSFFVSCFCYFVVGNIYYLVVIPVFALIKVGSEYIKSRGFPSVGVFFEFGLWPILLCVMLVIGFDLYLSLALSVGFSLFIMMFFLGVRYGFPNFISFERSIFEIDFKELLSLYMVGWLNNVEVYVPIALVGYLYGDSIAAAFGVGARISFFVFTISSVVGAIYAPKMAKAHKEGGLWFIYRRARLSMFFMFLPVVILALVLGEMLVGFFISVTDFSVFALLTMVVSKWLLSLLGPVDYLASMTGCSGIDVRSSFISFGVCLILSVMGFGMYWVVCILAFMSPLRYFITYVGVKGRLV